jgi:hypothetical protein
MEKHKWGREFVCNLHGERVEWGGARGREGGALASRRTRDQSIVAKFGIAIAFNVIDFFTSFPFIRLSWI